MKIKLLLLLLFFWGISWGQISITSNGTAFTQNFDGMNTSGTATLPSGFKIGSDWSSGTTATTLAYGSTGTGVVTGTSGGGAINWANGTTASATDRSLGFLSTGSYSSPRSIILAVTNTTGTTISTLDVSWNYEKYRSGSRAYDWTFFHGSATTAATSNTTGDLSYPADANNTVISNPPLTVAKTVSITGLSIGNGTTYYLRWTYTGNGGSSNSQGLGIDDFSVTSSASSTLSPPTLTAATSPTVDNAFNVTFTDDATWRAAITSVTVGGTTLTAGATFSAGNLTLNSGTSNPGNLLQTAGSKSIVVKATGYTDATVTQAIGAGAAIQLLNNTAPTSPTANGGALATQPKVNISDLYDNIVTSNNSTVVTVTATQGTWTLGGTLSATAVNGVATFSGLTATSVSAVTGATLTYAASGLGTLVSGLFNIPAPAPANDLCGSAVSITTGAAAISGTLLNATFTTPFTKKDVWYSFTPTCTGTATITVTGFKTTTEDVDIEVFSNSNLCPTIVTTIGSSTGSTGTETITQSFTSGVTYFIRVLDFGSIATVFTIGVSTPTPVTAAITTGSTTLITSSSATFGASASTFGVCPSTTTKGFVYSQTALNTNPINGGSNVTTTTVTLGTQGAFTQNNTGLAAQTSYSYKAFLFDGTTYTYGAVQTFATLATDPPAQPTGATITNITTTSMDLNWVEATTVPTGYIVIRRIANTPASPVDGTPYNIGDAIATSTVAYVGSLLTTANTSLTEGTEYRYSIFSYNGSGSSTKYRTTSPLNITAFTLSKEPTSHPTTFTATAAGATTINLAFSAASTITNATGYLILRKTGSAPTGLPADGGVYAGGAIIGDATVVTTISSAATTTFAVNSLTPGTNYYFSIIPFGKAANDATTNYFIAPTIKTANALLTNNSTDVVGVTGSEAAFVSSLQNVATIANNTQGAKVWEFRIRDGGATGTDTDGLPTLITGLTITRPGTSSVDFAGTIQTAAIFDSLGTLVATNSTSTATTLVFSSLNLSIPNNTTLTYSLRISLKTTGNEPLTIDGKDLGFSISNGNVITPSDGTSSKISSFSAASTPNDTNIIAVVATRLAYVQNATNANIGSGMTPAVTVSANDVNGNRDRDFITSISITSTGTLTGTPVGATPTLGLATFTGLTHSVAGTGLTLTTSNTNGLTNTTSNAFNVSSGPSVLAQGDLAIIASQSATTTDKFAFVILRDINIGTEINFTDNGMSTPTTGRTGEGFLTYTAPSALCAGTVIYWESDALLAPAISPGWSTNSGTTSDFQLNGGGDNIFAFQGVTTNWGSQSGVTVLFGILTGVAWSPTTASTTQTSCIPNSLSTAYTYNFPTINDSDVYLTLAAANFSGTAAAIITNITNTANYTVQNGTFTMPAYNSILVAPDNSALSVAPICLGDDATVTLSSNNLNAGTYTITYTLTGANTQTTTTTSMVFNSGNGNFIIPGLANSGNTTLTIAKINNGCDKGLSPNTLPLVIGGTSTWNGTWVGGAPTLADNVILSSDFNTQTNGNISACKCTVNSGINVTVAASGVVNLVKNLTLNGTATFNVQNNASLVQSDNNAVNTGSIKVDRTTSTYENFDYVYWSSPVVGATIGAPFASWRLNRAYEYVTSNFLDLYNIGSPIQTSGVPDSFDDNGDDWQNVSGATVMTPAKGYIVMTPYTAAATTTSASFNGVPNNGVFTIPLALSANNSSNTDDFNLVGNPYPSALNADSFINANIIAGGAAANNISGTIYIWTHVGNVQIAGTNPGPQAYNFNANDYATYTLAGGVGTSSGSGSAAPTGKIASGQAFFVEAETTNNLVFNNSMRSGSYLNNQFFRTTNNATQNSDEKDRLRLNFKNVDNMFSQQLIGYFDNATIGYDYGYDGMVSQSQNYVSFYSLMPNNPELYRIQAQSSWDNSKTVALGYSSSVSGSSSISIGSLEGVFNLDSTNVYLQDNLLNVTHNLKQSPYVFNTAVGTFNARFVLKYVNTTLGTIDNTDYQKTVIVAKKDQQLIVKSAFLPIEKIAIYDLLGRKIIEKTNVNKNELAIDNLVLNQQTIIVKVTLENGIVVNRKVVF